MEGTEAVDIKLRYHLHKSDFGLLQRPLLKTTPFGRGFLLIILASFVSAGKRVTDKPHGDGARD